MFRDVLKNSVHVHSHLSRNSGIFSIISGTVGVYDNYTREISLLWRFSATSRIPFALISPSLRRDEALPLRVLW